ncbi:hypothetical protein KPH14_005927 [Odynerus spinipes]|uniref:Uncharacterized protein n=1 Tax=Odynerus spinipes TaxID=1348599 RepID=A0AAD9VP26_9HYME|nr:hypothetical protein KPH14_005927 [Odynerus spinipes]
MVLALAAKDSHNMGFELSAELQEEGTKRNDKRRWLEPRNGMEPPVERKKRDVQEFLYRRIYKTTLVLKHKGRKEGTKKVEEGTNE